jgi:hypothetical protein
MTTNTTSDDAVREYLRSVDQHLGGLPMLQRRELVNDLEAHIAAERAEGGAHSEGQVLEILERLGSPEVVAAAAYAEAGPAGGFPLPPPAAVAPPAVGVPQRRPSWVPLVVAVVAVTALLFLLGLAGLMFFARSATSEPVPAGPAGPPPAEPVPAGPERPGGIVLPPR